jgi:3-hydroxybutyryl-CoA dehydrogenase
VVIKKVGVVGAGVMGSGIAQVTAAAGYAVMMIGKDRSLTRAIGNIESNLNKMVKQEVINEAEKTDILSRVMMSNDLNSVKDCQLVIEAVPEVLELKTAIFKQLESICPRTTIFASNTSTLPVSILASATRRKDKVIGTHFMNPVSLMKGVEVIYNSDTARETIENVKKYITRIGKEPCEAKDHVGFIVSRLVCVLMNEAIRCVMDGNNPEEVDKAMKLCCNFPVGPIDLCDLIGSDVVMQCLESMQKELGLRVQPCDLLKSQVTSGKLGRKSGKGFYNYRVDNA